ncbi:glycosyltransferase [Plesiomonas shigelloides]|nr:glycosyltransferase [Plesiomonas shigelloides]
MMKKNIVHVVNLSDFGGVERLLSDNFLFNQDAQHTIINTSNQINPALAQFDTEVCYATRIIQHKPWQYPAFLRKKALWHKIKKLNPSHVVIWNQIVSLAEKPDDIKAIYYDHGAAWELNDNAKVRRFFHEIDGCISVSLASKKILQHRFSPNGNIAVVLNGVKMPPHNLAHPKQHSESMTELVIGCAARLTPLKALGILPLIAEQLNQRNIHARFILAGDGEERPALEALIQKKNLSAQFEFRGFVRDMASFYQDINLYISPSAHETCSLSCIEAMSYGVPVIASNIDGQPEIVENGVTGYCIPALLDQDDYCQQTGMAAPFNNVIYYPDNDRIDKARLMSPVAAAEKIQSLDPRTLASFSEHAAKRAHHLFNIDNFRSLLISTIKNF